MQKPMARLSGLLFMLVYTGFSALNAQVKFIQNQGQWPQRVAYRAALSNGNLWVTDSGLLFSMWDPAASEKMHNRSLHTFTLQCHAFYLQFRGADWSRVSAAGPAYPEVYNFFQGADPKHWKSGVPAFAELLVTDLYPGVNLRIMGHGADLKYNLECRDMKAARQIVWQYPGVDEIQLQEKAIRFRTSIGDFTDTMPQVTAGTGIAVDVPAQFVKSGNGFALQVPPKYGEMKNVVVDPLLVFSTFSGSRADNFGCTGTYDEQGNGYAGGTVFNLGLPVTSGAYQVVFGGGVDENLGYGDGRDAAILKFSPNGSSLLYCTYLGGSNNEQPHSMVASASGELYVMGSTRSGNFPVTGSAYDRSHNGNYDFFVARFSPDGRKLLGSTFIGGLGMDAVGADRENEPIDNFPLLYNYADEFRGEIITDGNSVYVSGMTYSTSFPRSNNSGWFGGKEDAVVFSLDTSLSALLWSQNVGSTGYESFYGIALGKHNDLFVSGGTTSQDLPSRFSKFTNTYKGGMADGLVMRFNKLNGNLLAATYMGTADYDQVYFAQTDNSGLPYFFGISEGAFPVVAAKWSKPNTAQFIARMDTGLLAVNLSTTFGGNNNVPNLSPSAFLVDRCERIFISGWGGDVNDHLLDLFSGMPKTHKNHGSTFNMPISADAVQKTTDGSDFYFAVFSKNLHSLAYGSYSGGISNSFNNAEEHVDGGTSRFDKKGIIYQSVCAGCGRNGLFPTTPGAWSRTMNSNNCNNALVKIDFQIQNKKPFMTDTLIEVVATDIISLRKLAFDPDPFDTLDLAWSWTKTKPTSSSPFVQKGKGIGSALLTIDWPTDCNSFWNDTFTLRVMIFDRGCPKADTNWATIKILIREPPRVIPPEAICVSFDRVSAQMKVSWPATTQSARFFKEFQLWRVNPDATEVLLSTITNTNAGEFTDAGVVNPAVNDYCYYLLGINTCGVTQKPSQMFCTVRELNIPIESVGVKFATVEEDRRVLVSWEQSKEPDFKEYELYRYPRGQAPGIQPLAYTTDTTYRDSSFDVDAESYCYSLIVTDQCGHISKHSNPGCNVVIKGTATGRPWYWFDFTWQNYVGWQNGVLNWFMERQYAQKPFTFLKNTGTDTWARDDKLDYDWGGYWYRVTAIEDQQGVGRSPYQSQSNWIYLYQPPELWVPSGITINGDKLNDVWGTVPVFVRNYHMRVYNRWGQKVWETTDKKQQWDGNVNGTQPEDGVFAWYVEFDGWDDKHYRMTGTVTLLH
ncbi:MAG: gliding motility-associated C-terminal domain-containing protein [Bacteroidetes bacterium]|nr:gliding motility-associated C-terminal domain-containing protein [Bacteroidota bacterium]